MDATLADVAKNETILIVAAILALISCFIVPPDMITKATFTPAPISQLICLMIGMRIPTRIGVFQQSRRPMMRNAVRWATHRNHRADLR